MTSPTAECLIWEDGPCDGKRRATSWSGWPAGGPACPGRLVVIWDNAPCHIAKVVTAHAEELGIELVFLPGYSPDLNPIERLWDWMREEVTRGHCHASLAALSGGVPAVHRRDQRRPRGGGRSTLAQVRTRPGVSRRNSWSQRELGLVP